MTKEQHNAIIENIKATAGEQSGALIADDLVTLMNDYSVILLQTEDLTNQVNLLTQEKSDLITANGKLFQKVGFEKAEELPDDKKSEEEIISVDDIINEKGEMI